MVRTYWFVPGFNEASGNLDLQPFARIDHVEACRPRAEMHLKLYAPRTEGASARVRRNPMPDPKPQSDPR
jgi:hypothetical protein